MAYSSNREQAEREIIKAAILGVDATAAAVVQMAVPLRTSTLSRCAEAYRRSRPSGAATC